MPDAVILPGVDMRVPLFWGCVPWLEKTSDGVGGH